MLQVIAIIHKNIFLSFIIYLIYIHHLKAIYSQSKSSLLRERY
ncbi:hypothetical protein SeH_A3030 [Salmonella enterica subsp. enterica serovar Hadar str. RI_05P066]|uniref:Uncharacterized protein n=1 Tax=Salmonella virchow (strain SL491) TaxID=465517 RepID=A0A6C8F551_SALV4|nr:hypothetical protein SeV_B2562 [Salmonella enterica subsp. enterica serovar Virchow str. SL491]EDZ36026.1 hypothetical protein SeH_A3030 [Salmonella enterica subsp. enterica serovar Hadar str. RI_05P066]ETO88765.1 hypothetical protein Sesv_2249 [Salmonella enterica subsp. enterica serovar Virchow str. SVQ1]